jgi:hypothetical protein
MDLLTSLAGHPVFASSPADIGRIDASHHIRVLPDTAPIARRPYRTSEMKKCEIDRQVKDLLQRGLIQPSHSPWAAPVTLAPEKDGGWRFCIDYRDLNRVTSASAHQGSHRPCRPIHCLLHARRRQWILARAP